MDIHASCIKFFWLQLSYLSFLLIYLVNAIYELVYTIEGEGYFDKNGKPLDDETTIKHLTSEELK